MDKITTVLLFISGIVYAIHGFMEMLEGLPFGSAAMKFSLAVLFVITAYHQQVITKENKKK